MAMSHQKPRGCSLTDLVMVATGVRCWCLFGCTHVLTNRKHDSAAYAELQKELWQHSTTLPLLTIPYLSSRNPGRPRTRANPTVFSALPPGAALFTSPSSAWTSTESGWSICWSLHRMQPPSQTSMTSISSSVTTQAMSWLSMATRNTSASLSLTDQGTRGEPWDRARITMLCNMQKPEGNPPAARDLDPLKTNYTNCPSGWNAS